MKLPLAITQMIYTLGLFQTMDVFCGSTIKMQQLGKKLKQMFEDDFNITLEKGNVLIWKRSGKCKPFTLIQYNGEDIQFGSKETYLIATMKPQKTLTIHYWLGRHSSSIDIEETAVGAVFLANNIPTSHKLIYITREFEGMESESFQHTIKMFNRHAESCFESDEFASYLDIHLPSPRPNLYVVRGKRYSRIKKIPVSLGIQWLKEKDTCLVLEVEYKVENMLPMNVYCSSETNENHIIRSKTFATQFFGYTTHLDESYNLPFEDMSYTQKIENDRLSNIFKQFIEVLEDNRFYKPNEVDDSGDHLKNADKFVIDRDSEILLFDVTNDGLKENYTRPIHNGIFQIYSIMGYVLDTKSIAGVFLVLTNSYTIQDRVKAIQLAEMYMEEKYPISSGEMMRMRIEMSGPNRLDCTINMSDFPSPLMRTLPDYELE